MLNSLTIKGFRCFRDFHVEPLSRVNLFVGKNGSGKTSILDAAELATMGAVEGLVLSAVRRREQILTPEVLTPTDERYAGHIIDPSHLFQGHVLEAGSGFAIESTGDIRRCVQCTAEHASVDNTMILSLRFVSHFTPKRAADRLSISPAGGVLPPPRRRAEVKPLVNFLRAEAIDLFSLRQLWDRVVLTPSEEAVIRALQIVEPPVVRLAFVGGLRDLHVRVKLSGRDQPLPLGTLGGGTEHMLALALSLNSAQGGFLMVDEIDTGLHYTVMLDMWRLVVETAQQLDVQVFATTHSLDCVRALARLRRRYPEIAEQATLHRVEKEASTTIVYDMDEVVVAAEGDIEVR